MTRLGALARGSGATCPAGAGSPGTRRGWLAAAGTAGRPAAGRQDGTVIQPAPVWLAAGGALQAGARALLRRGTRYAIRGGWLQGGGVHRGRPGAVPAEVRLLHAGQSAAPGLQRGG